MNSTGDQVKGTILAVDDTPANLHLLGGILLSSGYHVQVAEDGESALKLVHSMSFDLILLDIQLPDIDGFEVCRLLKADPQTHEIPVIFISAYADTSTVLRGFDLGGVDYITKPFQVKEVLARVANHLTLVRQRKQIEALWEQDRQRYEMLDQMKNRFIQMATHDLRNPLNIILGYAVLLEDVEVSERDAEFVRQAAHELQRSTDKMRTLVTDMLDLARLEVRAQLTKTPISVTTFLERSLVGFQTLANQKQIVLKCIPPAEDITVLGDVDRIERVIDNLLSNAIKYTPPGGHVEVTALANSEQVTIQVSDTGLGIPEEEMPRLFEAFFRSASPEHLKIEGTGLGLSIVKSIVEQHGGQVSATSQFGKGSTFSFTLPLLAQDTVRSDAERLIP